MSREAHIQFWEGVGGEISPRYSTLAAETFLMGAA